MTDSTTTSAQHHYKCTAPLVVSSLEPGPDRLPRKTTICSSWDHDNEK